VGGFERVYEIGKDFRNEGISTKHNPEFTVLEAYQAYGDYSDMMELAETCWATVAEQVLGSTTLERTGIDIEQADTFEALQAAIKERGLHVDPKPTWGKLVDELFSEYVEPTLIEPTFVIDYPREISPLAKQKPDNPKLVERFEFFIGGLELGNAFTELNDPV